ncbi:MAG: hypothetical protein ACJ8ER_03455 [Allosphingosinicella sp.]
MKAIYKGVKRNKGRKKFEAIDVTEFIPALSTAQPLPLGSLTVLCTAWILTGLIRHGADLLRGVADIIRAMNGK